MTKSINLFLCDDAVADEMDTLNDRARLSVVDGNMTWIEREIENFEKVCLLITPSEPTEPKWVDFLNTWFPAVEDVSTQSAGAILYLEALDRKFVIPFGTGHFHLDESKLVGDFGLMIAANGVRVNSLRFLDSNNPSAGFKARVQSDRLAGGSGFDLDSALAFIKRLGGISEANDLGRSLSGSNGLRFNGPDDVSMLIPALTSALAQYQSDNYRDRGLDIIGSLRPIADRNLIRTLDLLTINHIRNDDGEFVICSPVLLDWDAIGVFKYLGRGDRSAHSELSVSDYL